RFLPCVAPALLGIEPQVSDLRRRGNARCAADEVVQRIRTVQIGRQLAGQFHLPGHGGPTTAEIQFSSLSRSEVQRYTWSRAEVFVFPGSQVDPDADGHRRHARQVEAAVGIGDGLKGSLESRAAEAIEANRVQE